MAKKQKDNAARVETGSDRSDNASLDRQGSGESNVRSAQARGAEMRFHGAAELRGLDSPLSRYYDSGRFGRMFPLPPFIPPRESLIELGKPGGVMDGSTTNPDNPAIRAGFTFLGQFVDHDITFDPTSSLERQVDPEAISNFRSPTLELDSVYGAGPGASPHLYQKRSGGKLLIGTDTGGGPNDLPRNSEGTALTGDPRNDENVIVATLHLAFLKFHNAVFADVAAKPVPGRSIFEEAQERVRWHYQWIVLHEFLPHIVGKALVKDVLKNGRKFYKWRKEPFIPVEFAVAAYRFGHSQVRPGYRLNASTAFPIFAQPANPPAPGRIDLSGGQPLAPAEVIQWQRFFELGGPAADKQISKAIDPKLSAPLLNLPGFGGGNSDPSSLATRNLLRGVTFGLPTGQAVACRMGEQALTKQELADVKPLGFDERTPLWYYILREAEVRAGGATLGPVGGRIVAEVLIGLLEGDPRSFLRQCPGWKPTLGSGGDFKIADLLQKAGVA